MKIKILSRELVPHDQVPTELELSKQYEVSRITSKRALTELENEKLIYRIQGKGSFVSEDHPHKSQEKNDSTTILFILPFVNNPDLGNYAQGMLKYLHGKSYNLSIQPDTLLEEIEIDTLLSQYAGIILYPPSSHFHLHLLYPLYLNNYPTIIMDKQLDGVSFPTITADNFQGGYDATQHLLSLGHKHIVFMTSNAIDHSSSIRERYLGYLKALHDSQITFNRHQMVSSDLDKMTLHQNFVKMITAFQLENITGIVTENDITAIHFMKLARKQGLQVPSDFAVIGFDNLQASSLIDPTLSTIAQDFEQLGYLAIEQLIGIIENRKQTPQNITVPVRLIARESTNFTKKI